LHTCPEVYEPAFGNKGQPVANEEEDDHNESGHHLVRRGGPEDEIKREDTKDDPNVRA
jgi:hypothetical protein